MSKTTINPEFNPELPVSDDNKQWIFEGGNPASQKYKKFTVDVKSVKKEDRKLAAKRRRAKNKDKRVLVSFSKIFAGQDEHTNYTTMLHNAVAMKATRRFVIPERPVSIPDGVELDADQIEFYDRKVREYESESNRVVGTLTRRRKAANAGRIAARSNR